MTYCYHYQNIFCSRRNVPIAKEVLLREFNGHTIAQVANDPSFFTANHTGLIQSLAESIRLDSLKSTSAPMYFINVTPDQASLPCFIDDMRYFYDAGLSPSQLTVELTEVCTPCDIEQFMRSIEFLREQGHPLAVDDFGSGVSNFELVMRIQPSILKIDRSMLLYKGDRSFMCKILNGIIQFSHSLGARVIIEGVENDDMLDVCYLTGADMLQGFLLHKPTPFEDDTYSHSVTHIQDRGEAFQSQAARVAF